MLTFTTGRGPRDCGGVSRRDFLKIGALGLGGLTLSQLLAARAESARIGSFVRDKAVVLLFLSGGASHIETFDPKMSAPYGIRSLTGETKTSLAGVSFGGTFPQLAARASRLAVVRSFCHNSGGHVEAIRHVLSGGIDVAGKGKEGYSLGSLATRLRGANDPATGMPTYALLTADEVDSQYESEKGRVTSGSRPGELGLAYAPFEPGGTGAAMRNMELHIPRTRLEDRRLLLHELDRLDRQVDAAGAMAGIDKFEQQAFDLVLRGAKRAFDLSEEAPQTIDRYDTRAFQIGHKRLRASTLGHQLLLARRLCESGCGFVTVHSAGWDMHADTNNPGVVKGMNMLGRPLDKAVSAFLDDVAERRLSDKILLVITGDFGRTPKVNGRGGRDHWANLATLAFAGGGLKMGQVIGQSAPHADVPAFDPVGPANLLATVAHTVFDVGTLRLDSSLPGDLRRLVEQGQPIGPLFG